MTRADGRKLRMGMVGGGQGAFIGAIHRMAAAIDGQIDLVAGCFSRDPATTRETGSTLFLDPARCYDTYAQMAAAEAALPEDRRIDFVSIVTPPRSHFDIASAFLKAGFHVICDKPLTITLGEARELESTVKQSGLIFGLTFNYTGYPMVREAKEIIRAGGIGHIRRVMVEYLMGFLAQPIEEGKSKLPWRLDPSEMGIAGTMGEAGVHCQHLLEFVTGVGIAEICGERTTFLPNRVLEEDAGMLIRLDGGARGAITVSQIACGEENNLNIRVYGSTGSLGWWQEDPNRLHVNITGQPKRILTTGHPEYLAYRANRATRLPQGHPEGYLEAFANIYSGFCKAVRDHEVGCYEQEAEHDFPTISDGVRSIAFIEAAVKSCDSDSIWTAVTDGR